MGIIRTRRFYLSIFISILNYTEAFVQPSDMLIDHMEEFYGFNFKAADTNTLKPYEQDVLKTYSNWYKFLLYPDSDSICDEFMHSLDLLSESTGLISDQVSKWFFSIYFEQYKSRVLLIKGEYLKAYMTSINIFDVIDDIDTNLLGTDDKLYYQFLEASRLYFMGYLQDKYIFLRPFLDGNARKQLSKGLELLNIVVKNENIFLKTEASYLLMKIYKELQGSHDLSLKYADWLVKKYPGNIIFQLEYLRCLSIIEGKETCFNEKKEELYLLLGRLELTQIEREHLTRQLNTIEYEN